MPLRRAPPLAAERLSQSADGRLIYQLKQRWRDGTTHVGFEPLELLEKLAALVPPPRVNLVRYHGVLAPASRHRARVVPAGKAEDTPTPGPGIPTSRGACAGEEEPPIPRHPRNYSWAELMRRVFEIDVLECPRCRRRMRILAAIVTPGAIRAILDCPFGDDPMAVLDPLLASGEKITFAIERDGKEMSVGVKPDPR